MQHPRVGRLVLEYIAFVVEASPSLSLRVFLPLPDADTAVKLQRLWAEPGCLPSLLEPQTKASPSAVGMYDSGGSKRRRGFSAAFSKPFFLHAFNGRGPHAC